ncbi:4Fe-4S ferredoxin [Streptacidiphilus pinicola]|uniref:4Fe-4S ferredoxin n=1 Tax=Streptacidiphilus pinicola TaxID=2219663 RepID=A0A2X0IPN7_9ACTN|nr:4Fe-4S binding protein [Streptacidiphilus pinicola]RAG87154.1 4Fe-4S ferredoxin [Streptacidiphilus pinicola]
MPASAQTGPSAAPVAVSSRCQGCGACLLTCPTHAIRPHGDPLLVLADRCTGCLECLDVCPVDAIDLLSVDHPHVDLHQEHAS